LTPELHPVVSDVCELISEEVQAESQLSSVEGFLNQLFQKRKVQMIEERRFDDIKVRSLPLRKSLRYRKARNPHVIQGDYVVQYVDIAKLSMEETSTA
jgi:hypothetical protein